MSIVIPVISALIGSTRHYEANTVGTACSHRQIAKSMSAGENSWVQAYASPQVVASFSKRSN
jgi:hypothetical protein